MTISFKGNLEKLSWKQVRDDVIKVNPDFAAIIDELDPNDEHWVAKVTYPYGSLVMQRAVLQLPNSQGDIVPITDHSLSSEIREGLSYNLDSNPVSLVLKNSFEIYLPLEDRTIPVSGLIKPGSVFGAWRVLDPMKTEHPAFIWDMSAGARTVLMLPKITEELKYKKLRKVLDITSNAPRSLMEHWEIFRQIANSSLIGEKVWTAQILYFSQDWFNHLNDIKWTRFYHYFYSSGWSSMGYWRNKPFWDMVISLILQDYEGKPNGHIIDTSKHLLYVGIGSLPAFSPALDTLGGPFDLIQKVYKEIYDIKRYPPVILKLSYFDIYNKTADPVYYSLQFPNATEFKPSSRVKTNLLTDLHEISSLMNRYEREFSSDKFNLKGTSMSLLFHKAKYDYFHNTTSLHKGMLNSEEMSVDENLRKTIDGKIHDLFPGSSLFGMGCIRISPKN